HYGRSEILPRGLRATSQFICCAVPCRRGECRFSSRPLLRAAPKVASHFAITAISSSFPARKAKGSAENRGESSLRGRRRPGAFADDEFRAEPLRFGLLAA